MNRFRLRGELSFHQECQEGASLMNMTFQDFVTRLENRLLRSLTEREWEFTRWMYEKYQKEERSF